MSAAHFIYIPCILLVGVGLGFVLGARLTHDAYEAARRKREAQQQR